APTAVGQHRPSRRPSGRRCRGGAAPARRVCRDALLGRREQPAAAAGRGATGTGRRSRGGECLPTREEFRERVVGKSKDEILRLRGRPVKTNTVGGDDGWD